MIKLSNRPTKVQQVSCLDVVHAYGEISEREPFGLGGTISKSVLPHDKVIIREAIVNVAFLKCTPISNLGKLKTGSVLLALFQSGGGGTSVLWQTRPSQSPRTREELASYVSKPNWPEEKAMFAIVENEMMAPSDEWDRRVTTVEVN